MPDPKEKFQTQQDTTKTSKLNQPGVITLTDEEINRAREGKEPNKAKEAVKNSAQVYLGNDLEAIKAIRKKERGLDRKYEPINTRIKSSFSPEELEKIKKERPDLFAPFEKKDPLEEAIKENSRPYIFPAVQENLDEKRLSNLEEYEKRQNYLYTKSFFGKSKAFSSLIDDATKDSGIFPEMDMFFDAEEDDGLGMSFLKGLGNIMPYSYNMLRSTSILGTGMLQSTFAPGMSDEEEEELEELTAKIRQIKDPIIKEQYNIIKGEHKESLSKLENLVGDTTVFSESRDENEDFLFNDNVLLNDIKDLYQRTEEEYESYLNDEGWFGGLTEGLPEAIRIFQNVAYALQAKKSAR
jgi:hypothetical protein